MGRIRGSGFRAYELGHDETVHQVTATLQNSGP